MIFSVGAFYVSYQNHVDIFGFYVIKKSKSKPFYFLLLILEWDKKHVFLHVSKGSKYLHPNFSSKRKKCKNIYMLIKATSSTGYYLPFLLMHIILIQAENEQASRLSLACKWSISLCITPCIWKQLVCHVGVFPCSFSTASQRFPPNPNSSKTEKEEQANIRK